MKPARKAFQLGFTLIELMITVAVVAILAKIAYGSYSGYVVRANRSAAETFLLQVANQEAQYLLDARAYTNVIGTGGLNLLVPSNVSASYSVTIPAASIGTSPPTFTVTATPTGSQLANDSCGSLSVDQTGAKSISGSTATVAKCW